MLAKKRYARHAIQNKTIPILFLSLVLISLTYPSINADSTSAPSGDIQFSAGSKLPIGRTVFEIPIPPTGFSWIIDLRWHLYDPEGNIVFYKDINEVYVDKEAGKMWVEDPEIYVGWLPQQGQWKVDLTSGFFDQKIRYEAFNVGESSFVDNIMAPIYWSWGGVPVVGVGEFSWALPSVFWLTSPIWVLAIMFIALAFYVRSIRLAASLVKESGRRFKESIKKKV